MVESVCNTGRRRWGRPFHPRTESDTGSTVCRSAAFLGVVADAARTGRGAGSADRAGGNKAGGVKVCGKIPKKTPGRTWWSSE